MKKPDHMKSMPALITGVQELAQNAALFIQKERETFSVDHIEHKAYNDLVSYVDRKTEEILIDGLSSLLPGSGFICEEGGLRGEDAEYRWLVDPLDGTTNFIHNVPAYCISIALQIRGETVLGLVKDVNRKEEFLAQKDAGAWLNGKRIKVSSNQHLSSSLLATGFPHVKTDVLDDYLAAIKDFLHVCHGIRRFGSAALDLAWVGCGRLDGFFEIGLQSWDVAAGALIIQEAGGSISGIHPSVDFIFGKQIVGSNGAIHQSMLDVIGRHVGFGT